MCADYHAENFLSAVRRRISIIRNRDTNCSRKYPHKVSSVAVIKAVSSGQSLYSVASEERENEPVVAQDHRLARTRAARQAIVPDPVETQTVPEVHARYAWLANAHATIGASGSEGPWVNADTLDQALSAPGRQAVR